MHRPVMHMSSPRRRRGRYAAAAVAAALTGALITALPATAGAAPAESAPRSAPGTAGADLPFTTVEAEDAQTDGTAIGPDHTQGTVASEASGRQAVELQAGQYVEFTLPTAANALTVAYNLPQGGSGSLAVSVGGQSAAEIPLTSRYMYKDTPWIDGSQTHHLFTSARLLLDDTAGSGETVRLTASSTTTVDLADFELAPEPAAAPSGAVDVTDLGADPTGASDSTQAFREAAATARGGTVWIPPGTFTLAEPVYVDDVEIAGAGHWHSVVNSSRFVNQGEAPGGKVTLRDFAVIGDVTTRVDSDPDNFVNGSLGAGSRVSGMWVQHLKVGLWLTGVNDDLVVEDNRILDMVADGLNLNGTAKNVQVRNNYLRNTGDDALAMWSLNQTNESSSFTGNTIVQPNLANGIAIYGGRDITVADNLIRDTNALGSGIAISNQKFAEPFFPLAGTITVRGNELVRTGAMNPNWGHPMAALRVDAYDSDIAADVDITDTTVTDSPYSAFQFVSGGGTGLRAQNVTVDGATVSGVGTVVVQAETAGAATFRDVTATDVGVAGVYNCPYPAGADDFTLDADASNSGWDDLWDDCTTWPGQDD